MHWSPRIETALYRAAKLHEGLFRKGPDHLPALVHLVGVASIVSEHTDDEDVVVAALLHDSIEDTSFTPENLREEFGDRVMGIVMGVTIPEMHEGKETGVWSRDRRRYFENLRQAPMESVLVAAADKIHNFTTIIRDYTDNVDGFRNDFAGAKEDRISVYGAICTLIVERLGPTHPLVQELAEVWKKYETFVNLAL